MLVTSVFVPVKTTINQIVTPLLPQFQSSYSKRLEQKPANERKIEHPRRNWNEIAKSSIEQFVSSAGNGKGKKQIPKWEGRESFCRKKDTVTALLNKVDATNDSDIVWNCRQATVFFIYLATSSSKRKVVRTRKTEDIGKTKMTAAGGWGLVSYRYCCGDNSRLEKGTKGASALR